MRFAHAFGASGTGSGSFIPPSPTATTYGGMGAAGFPVAAENAQQVPLSEAVTITDLLVAVATAPGAGASWTFTVRKNGADTAATVTISGAATSATFTGTVTCVAGDLLTIAAVPSTGTVPAATGDVSGAIYFATTGDTFLLFGKATASASSTVFYPVAPSASTSTTEALAAMLVPLSGTVTKFAAICNASGPGTAGSGKSYAISLRLNDSSDNFTSTIADAATTAPVASGSLAIAAGDTLSVKVVPTATPTARGVAVCLSITTAVPGESMRAMSSVSPASTTTSYNNPFGAGTTWGGTEAGRQVPQRLAQVLRSMRVKLSAAPGSGTSRTITFRNAGADTPLTVTVADTATTGSVTPGTPVTLSGSNATAALKNTVSGVPTDAVVHTSYVVFTDQTGAIDGGVAAEVEVGRR